MAGVPAFTYAYEARPYGLVVGATGAAILSWHRAAATGSWPWRAALALSLSAAVASHWHGVLSVLPIVAGEAVRTARRRRLDAGVLLALVVPVALLPTLLPFASQALTFRGMMPPPGSLGAFLAAAYDMSAGGLVVMALLAVSLPWLWPSSSATGRGTEPDLIAAAAVAAALPIAGFLVAHVTGGQLAARYVLQTTVGVAILLGMFVERATSSRPRAAALAVALLLGLALAATAARKDALEERSMVAEHEGRFSILGIDAGRLAPQPIVVPDLHVLLQLHFYGDARLRSQLVYITGFNAMGSRIMTKLVPFEPLTVLSIDELALRSRDVYVYQASGASEATPVLPALVARGGTVTDSGVIDATPAFPRPGYLYNVRLP
jgi:hypothetical protein